jgi:cyclopropane fatty-acyl-phospholipid synthase-like methyltransferase
MQLVTSAQLRALIEGTGWTIVHWRNRREESMPTVRAWHRRLHEVPPSDDEHLETLRSWTARVMTMEAAWAAANPLIEVVAD